MPESIISSMGGCLSLDSRRRADCVDLNWRVGSLPCIPARISSMGNMGTAWKKHFAWIPSVWDEVQHLWASKNTSSVNCMAYLFNLRFLSKIVLSPTCLFCCSLSGLVSSSSAMFRRFDSWSSFRAFLNSTLTSVLRRRSSWKSGAS